MDSAEGKPLSGSAISGKLVIVVIVTVAFCAAAISWYFRYNATHRAAEFWGPKAVRLIRDAPRVDFFRLEPIDSPNPEIARIPLKSGNMVKGRDQRIVSNTPGLTHLRNALLEDHNFNWPARVPEKDPLWQWALLFRNDSPRGIQSENEWVDRLKQVTRGGTDVYAIFILFTKDCSQATLIESLDGKVISCQPISAGLRQMFAEFSSDSAPAKQAR